MQGYRPPLTWLVFCQACIHVGYDSRPSYIIGFSIDLPFCEPEPLFVWTPDVYMYPGNSGVNVRLPLWILLIPAAPIAGHALAGALRTLRARRTLNACPSCDYDLAGLPLHACCPECGLYTEAHPP